MLSWPGEIAPGQVCDECGVAMDVLPTFLGWAGGSPPAHVDGTSLGSALLGKSPWPHRDLFWAYDGQFAIRRGEWKFIQNYRERLGDDLRQQPWLSNLTLDPTETRTFISASDAPLPDLKKGLDSWRSSL
jgi:arylsulfatase A-like enzyme